LMMSGAMPEGGEIIGPEGCRRSEHRGDLAVPETGEGSFPGNRQNVFERGLAQAERVVLAPRPTNGTA
jgi:hypothetical protein